MAISLTFNIRDCHAVARNDENRTLSTSPLRCVYSSSYNQCIRWNRNSPQAVSYPVLYRLTAGTGINRILVTFRVAQPGHLLRHTLRNLD